MKTNIFKPVLIAAVLSCGMSVLLNVCLPTVDPNNHWLFSLVYFSVLSLIINVFYIQKTDGKTFVSLIQGASIARFLVSGIAFFIYAQLYPNFNTKFIIHFMGHYFVFTFFEMLFLLKIVNSKPNAHE